MTNIYLFVKYFLVLKSESLRFIQKCTSLCSNWLFRSETCRQMSRNPEPKLANVQAYPFVFLTEKFFDRTVCTDNHNSLRLQKSTGNRIRKETPKTKTVQK